VRAGLGTTGRQEAVAVARGLGTTWCCPRHYRTVNDRPWHSRVGAAEPATGTAEPAAGAWGWLGYIARIHLSRALKHLCGLLEPKGPLRRAWVATTSAVATDATASLWRRRLQGGLLLGGGAERCVSLKRRLCDELCGHAERRLA
jgi:hypothetical protein